MHMAKVVVNLLSGDYADEEGMIADLRLMVENCRRYVPYVENVSRHTCTLLMGAENDAMFHGNAVLVPQARLPARASRACARPAGKRRASYP